MLAIGQGATEITPLQMAQAMCVIGNGGKLYQARLVQQVQDITGEVVSAYSVRVKREMEIPAATLEQKRATFAGQLLNQAAGVYVSDLGNEQHSMSIRQPISTNSVYQYLEDGIPIRPLGVFNHNALNETNMNGSAGVEVVKGAASSLYGSNAVGGAVNFLSLAPSRTPTGSLGLRHDSTDGFTRVDTGASNTWGLLSMQMALGAPRENRLQR
jgi:outer membrane receptor protein involved in Fe transport